MSTHLLYNTTTIHLIRQSQDMALHLIGKNLLLRLIAMLKQLLHDIVAKDVRHQL